MTTNILILAGLLAVFEVLTAFLAVAWGARSRRRKRTRTVEG